MVPIALFTAHSAADKSLRCVRSPKTDCRTVFRNPKLPKSIRCLTYILRYVNVPIRQNA